MRRLLLLVSAIVLLDTIFFAALAPLLPHYEEEIGLSKSDAGILSAVYAAGAFAGAIPGGLLAARLGVKPTVLLGLAVMVATSVVFGFAGSLWLLDAARFGQGIGSAFAWTGGLSWLIAAAPRERRGELLGIAMGAAVAGALLGPLLGGAAVLVGTGPAFTAVAAVGFGLAAWAWSTPAFPPGERQPLRLLFGAMRNREIAGGFGLVSVAAFLLGVISVLGPLRLDELAWSTAVISGIFLIGAGVEAAISPALGRWSDRRGRFAPVRAGLVLSIGASLALAWADGRWTYAGLVLFAMIVYGWYWVPGTALIADGAEASRLDQGYGVAILNIGWAPGNVVGAALGGALAAATDDAVVYVLAAGLCAVALVAVEAPGLRVPFRMTAR